MRPITLPVNVRNFAMPVFIAAIMAGCVQLGSPARTAAQECYQRTSQQSYYSPFTIAVAVVRAEQTQRKIALKASLKNFGKPAPERFPAEAKLAKIEAELARIKAMADARNRKLDEIETEVDSVKARMGKCYGIGYSGKQAVKKYAEAKKNIAEKRQFSANRLARVRKRHQSAAKRAVFVARWRADNAAHLKKKVGNTRLEIVEVARIKIFRSVSTRLTVAVTNITSSTILKPRNQRVWGYTVHPELGGSKPIGTSLQDSFGNSYKLQKVSPKLYGNEGRGIRPGQTKMFEVDFTDIPLESTKYVLISLAQGAYGQNQQVRFVIPADVFFGGMAGRSQYRR